MTDESRPPERAAMSPERWRAVDAALQAALACEPSRREAVVAAACGDDDDLRREVSSLLASHVELDDAFLAAPVAPLAPLAERYADDAARMPAPYATYATPPVVARPGRTVSGRAAVYAGLVMLALGLATGLVLDRAFFLRRSAPEAATGSWPTTNAAEAPLSIVDRSGRLVRTISADRPWTPRFSPDGRQVAYGAFGPGRQTSDLWITDFEAGTTRRVTDGDEDANDPQWSRDGAALAYSQNAPGGKDVMWREIGRDAGRAIANRMGTQFPSDWPRDGSALLVTEEAGDGRHDILVQPIDGSPARPWLATRADETTARASPDGRWVAYTSDASGRAEVYLDTWPRPSRRIKVSNGGGIHPAWRGDGRELYYWRAGALVAVPLGAPAGGDPPHPGAESVLFRAAYPGGVSTMYDVSPDGQRFVIARGQ